MLLDMPTIEGRVNSAPTEDYAKAIYSLTRSQHHAATTSDLARRLRLTRGSVSTMLKRLDTAGLVKRVPYHGVRLTPAGERIALRVIRRYRLLELFLHETLEAPWVTVDRYADRLEHAADDELIDIIATKFEHSPTG
jgi:DtxR family Mn-dependent transcriptional regulator